MVLQLLRPLVGAVLLLHRDRPDAAGDATDDGVLRVHAVGEEERQVRREVVDVHAACQIRLHVGETVGERERELADRVRPGLGDVIARDRHRVEVAHTLLDEPLLDVAHHPQRELGREQAGVLALVLLEDVRLDRAPHVLQGVCRELLALGTARLPTLPGDEGLDLLVDDRVEEEGEDGRRRAVDRHRDRGGWGDEVEAVVERLHVIEGGDRDTGGADLAVDVGARVGVATVEGDRVEGRRQARRRLALGDELEAAVGAEGVTLAGEHARRVLVVPLEGEDAGGEGEVAGEVLAAQEGEQVTPVVHPRQRDATNRVAGQRLLDELGVQLLVADLDHVLVARILLDDRRPLGQQAADVLGQVLLGRRDQAVQLIGPVLPQGLPRGGEVLSAACVRGILLGLGVIPTDRLGDLGEIADS